MLLQSRPFSAPRRLPPAFARLQARVAALEAEFALWRKAAGALALALGRLYPDILPPDAPAHGRPATIHAFRAPVRENEEGRHE